jgi:hypothetical protein
MPKNQLSKILEDPHRYVGQVHGANGILASLFRQMLGDLNISIARWGSLMADFISDARNNVPNNQKDRTSMRGNLTKEFSRPQMTWKVFCKGLRFLQITKIELTIRAHHPNGRTTSHSTVVNLGTRQQLNELLNDLESPDRDDDEHQEEDKSE